MYAVCGQGPLLEKKQSHMMTISDYVVIRKMVENGNQLKQFAIVFGVAILL